MANMSKPVICGKVKKNVSIFHDNVGRHFRIFSNAMGSVGGLQHRNANREGWRGLLQAQGVNRGHKVEPLRRHRTRVEESLQAQSLVACPLHRERYSSWVQAPTMPSNWTASTLCRAASSR